MTDADLIDTIAALYAPPDGYFDTVETTAGVTWGLRREPGAQLVVCRGSVTIEDWMRDLESEAARVVPGYPSLGHIPYGFGAGIVETYQAIMSHLAIGADLYFLGHSLGAAHAAILAGLWAADTVRPHLSIKRVVLCGCPKPGMVALSTLLGSVSIGSYRNGRDPVVDVPLPIPPLLEWRDLVAMTHINAPATDASWHGLPPSNPLSDHNIALYQRGVRAAIA